MFYNIVRPSGVKSTTISFVQSSYIAMGPKLADKADPSQELSVIMGAGYFCRILSVGNVLHSLDFCSSRLLLASLILFCSEIAAQRVTLLCLLGQSWVMLSQLVFNVEALDGCLQDVFEAFLLAASGTLSCQKLTIE